MFGLKTGGARRKRRYPVAILLAAVLGLWLIVFSAPAEGEFASSTGAHGTISCATTVTAVVGSNLTRRGIVVLNNGAATIFVGQGVPSALTTANWIPIAANASLTIRGYTGSLSCIVASGTVDLRYMEVNN